MRVLVAGFSLFLIGVPMNAQTQTAQTQTPKESLRSVLLEELRSTHNKSDWFVCADVAVANLTPEQANWTDGKGNHSVGQLTNHLVFWNSRTLAKLRGEPEAKFSGDNEETFNQFDAKRWADTVARLDQVMSDFEKLVEAAPEGKLAEMAPTISKISTHNAYHIGQIVFVRKEQGAWDASKGVK
jgi:uncharacterized damage-inducible protein DinB